MAPRSDSSENDLPFGGVNTSIGGRTRLHVPVKLRPLLHAPACRSMCKAHAAMLLAHARATCHLDVLPRQFLSPRQHASSARHVSLPHGKKKKKRRKKFGEAERGSSTAQIHPQGLYGLASKLSFFNLFFMQFP